MPDYSPFAAKAEAYLRYRIDYPAELIGFTLDKAALHSAASVADLGCGTGLWSRVWLAHARLVFGIEPDPDMRAAAERTLGQAAGFRCRAGSAEATGLPPHSIDVITAGNAFHYFDPVRARIEVERIAKLGGRVVLVDHRDPQAPSPFMQAYLEFQQRHTPEQLRVAHSKEKQATRKQQFFDGRPFVEATVFEQEHPLTLDALKGRFASTSIAPRPGEPRLDALMSELEELYARHAKAGVVQLGLRWVCTWAHWDR